MGVRLCKELHDPVAAKRLMAIHKLQVHILGCNCCLAAELKYTPMT